MRVSALIAHLQTLPQDMDVYVADWNEDYGLPSLLEAEEVRVERFDVFSKGVGWKESVEAVLIKAKWNW